MIWFGSEGPLRFKLGFFQRVLRVSRVDILSACSECIVICVRKGIGFNSLAFSL